jgi:long-subunit fatty acid transport protein
MAMTLGAVVPGAKDGKVKIEDATDWGYQPYVGLTWQMTDRALLGVVYRAEADVKLEGDINFRNLVIDKPKADDIELAWDNPQWLEVGLRYQFSEADFLFLNGGWQDWSEFGEKNEISTDGTTATLNREWDDTWHAGIGYAHRKPGGLGYTLGFSYDSSPVDDDKRTFDLPVDEIYKVSAGSICRPRASGWPVSSIATDSCSSVGACAISSSYSSQVAAMMSFILCIAINTCLLGNGSFCCKQDPEGLPGNSSSP